MAREMTGVDLLLLLRRLEPDELRLPARVILDVYDRPLCEDCGRHHESVWEALACDGLVDARRRRTAARRARRLAAGAPLDVVDDGVDDDELAAVSR